jgi:hypothetical protein
MSINVRELLLTPVSTPTEVVPLPELGDGVTVTVRGMTARDKGAFDMQFVTKGEHNVKAQKQMRERMLVACCIDESGSRLFTLEDVAALGLQSVAIVERIFDACQRVNGTNSKAVETAEKNSEAIADT